MALFQANHQYDSLFERASVGTRVDDTRDIRRITPIFGAGVELFSARFFRPRFEVRYLTAPKVTAGGNTFSPEALYFSVGFLTSW